MRGRIERLSWLPERKHRGVLLEVTEFAGRAPASSDSPSSLLPFVAPPSLSSRQQLHRARLDRASSRPLAFCLSDRVTRWSFLSFIVCPSGTTLFSFVLRPLRTPFSRGEYNASYMRRFLTSDRCIADSSSNACEADLELCPSPGQGQTSRASFPFQLSERPSAQSILFSVAFAFASRKVARASVTTES